MVILSLIFLTVVGINIFSNSVKKENVDAYIKDMEKQLSEELKIIK
jgi:hypothetical protein